jgi:hypothetical protein
MERTRPDAYPPAVRAFALAPRKTSWKAPHLKAPQERTMTTTKPSNFASVPPKRRLQFPGHDRPGKLFQKSCRYLTGSFVV